MRIGRVDITITKKNQINQERKLKRHHRPDNITSKNTLSVNLDISASSFSSDTDEPIRNESCANKSARRILKARSSAVQTPRLFDVPKINFDASNYVDIINWQKEITEPPIFKNLSTEEISYIVQSGGEGQLSFLRLPCHTQAVERAVKITTEAAISQCTIKSRLDSIKAKLESRAKTPKFDSKCHFKPN
ncbi:hypothetical protein EVAR_75559_1 [Eumeta japonica]|uniref:Uncharacterized protein n=1 Tax=Eumeta variegata TaxID=151549 RepID=A0A4C1UJZ9_EUMVA|nr:hypothetical protein EVAR_75559_1 [Eumeta japonica]